MRARRGIVFLGLVASLAMSLGAATPAKGGGLTVGLAVAVTADGARLVAGGSNRVLYELDPTTLEVKRRVWLGRQVMNLVFSPDGKVLVVESTAAVQWLKADTLEPFHTIEDASQIQPLPALGAVAMMIPSYTKPSIGIYGVSDAKEQASVGYDPRDRVAAYGVSADGKRIALLHKQKRDGNEEKITGRKIPEEIRKKKGADLAEFTQRHDGLGATYRVVDVASGKSTLEKQLWYTCQGYSDIARWQGDEVYVVGGRNQCARIDAEGEVAVFTVGDGNIDAFHVSPDGKTLWTSWMLTGRRTRVPELSSVTLEIDELEGISEKFKSFTAAADGTAFAGTTAFRVLRVDAEGKFQKIAPIY